MKKVIIPVLIITMLLAACSVSKTDPTQHDETTAPQLIETEPVDFTEPIIETTEPTTECTTEPTIEETEPASKYDTVPLYYQTLYNHVPFSGATVGQWGCGITCLAMVASYFLEEELLPDEMAHRFNISRDNPAACLDWGIDQLGLPLIGKYYGDEVFEKVWPALENGQVVIALMQKGSLFTDNGHFIVIAGMTEDGKYIVNDPNMGNYTKYLLMDGFENGFTKEQLTPGFNGVYIFEKKK